MLIYTEFDGNLSICDSLQYTCIMIYLIEFVLMIGYNNAEFI